MIHRQVPANLFALCALTVAPWLGLWPAADAVTIAPKTAAPEVTVQETSSCCEDAVPTEGCACCDLGCGGAGDAGCSRSTAAPTCRCANLGGHVFLATAWAALDPRLEQIGKIDLADQVFLSRTVQPPVPPPLYRLPTIG